MKRFLLFSFVIACGFSTMRTAPARSHAASSAQKTFTASQPPLQVVSAVSRKTHGANGDFDVDLPLTPPFGIESRCETGSHTIVVTWNTALVSGKATVIDGAGAVYGAELQGNTMVINLTGVPDGQTVTVSLADIVDNIGRSLPATTVTMRTLVGDTTANGFVNASDITMAKFQVGHPVTASNFRLDVNADGQIDASDIAIIKARSDNSLPGSATDARTTNSVLGSHTQSLAFSGPTMIDPTTTPTFTISTNLTFAGYTAYGLSYWLEVDDALAPFLSVTGASYFTFLDPTQVSPNPAPFDSTIGATSGFKTASRDLGATAQTIPDDAVPPGTYHVTDVTFSIAPNAPVGMHTLRSATVAPRASEVTDSDFNDNNITPANSFTFTVVAGPTPRPSATPKPKPTPGLTPTPTPRPSSTPK